jgi:hypothetical protein
MDQGGVVLGVSDVLWVEGVRCWCGRHTSLVSKEWLDWGLVNNIIAIEFYMLKSKVN